MSPHKVHLNAAEGEEKRIPTQPAPDTHPDHGTQNTNRESKSGSWHAKQKQRKQIRIMTRKTETENANQDHDTKQKQIMQIRIMTRETETENANQDHDTRNRNR
jgi:hypothetical protein